MKRPPDYIIMQTIIKYFCQSGMNKINNFKIPGNSDHSVNTISSVAINALQKAYGVWQHLGVRGQVIVKKNEFGDSALRADLAIEEEIINYFRQIKLPIQVHTEEHGVVTINKPEFLAVLDGLDGSRVYKKDRKNGRYGTMLAIFGKRNPSYRDYLACGIMEHASGRLYFATKGGGAYIIENGKKITIHTVSSQILKPEASKIYIDDYFNFNTQVFRKILKNFKIRGYGSKELIASSRSYMDLAAGRAEIVLECTRKRNLEIGSAYGLINEAGGLIVDIKGHSIGMKKYLTFGQNKKISVISAANSHLLEQLINNLK